MISLVVAVVGMRSNEINGDYTNEVCVENTRVKQYLENTLYDSDDYSYTNILNYCDDGFDKPNPGVITWKPVRCEKYEIEVALDGEHYNGSFVISPTKNSFKVYNLIPRKKCLVKVFAVMNGDRSVIGTYVFRPEGQVRMIAVDGVLNVRDIGGYICGKSSHVKYGLIYRGAALDERRSKVTDEGKRVLYDQLGVRTEIDLRNEYNATNSIIGKDCLAYGFAGKSYIEGFNDPQLAAQVFYCLYNSVLEGKPVYIHCSGGADRTEFICCMIEAVLGISESDICKDFEMSSFSAIANTNYYRRYRNMGYDNSLEDKSIRDFATLISLIKNSGTGTLSENAYDYFISAGVLSDDLDSFIRIMTESN